MIDPDGIRQRYAALSSILDERGRRLLVAAEAKAAGYGGIAAVWRATGVATSTIWRGLRDLAEAPALADEPQAQGHQISRTLVGELLHGLGFSLQANAKTREGVSHPDRDAQCAFIDAKVKTALATGEPVISVDAKKKEL